MEVEHQGKGTYTYKCDKPDCFFCLAKNTRKPVPLQVDFDQRTQHKEYRRQYSMRKGIFKL